MKFSYLLFLLIAGVQAPAQNNSGPSTQPTYLPSLLRDGRFYLKIPALGGDTILGFCDTGGGFTAVYPSTIERLKLTDRVSAVTIDGKPFYYILAKDIVGSPAIPVPRVQDNLKPYIHASFFAVPDEKQVAMILKGMPHDAFLGQFFFIEHAWTFDYARGKIFVNTPLSPNPKNGNIQALGFKKDSAGNKTAGHPSMKITVDGEVIDVLFDTGASFFLSENGKAGLGTDKTSAGGSFIAKSLFNQWHERHPSWKIIEKGELNGADLIEVPAVTAGNLTAGPVWFAKRNDEAWSKGMISSMDKVVKGAIGGSFLKYFTVQADYNSELIKFEK